MPVAELLERISAKELSEWIAFYQLEPWGTEVDLYGHAMTTSTLATVYRKEGAPPVSPSDVMPRFGRDPIEEMKLKAKVITDITKATDGYDT